MKIIIYTDGGTEPNPGRGAYAYVTVMDNEIIEQKGFFGGDSTTNNRMEMMAVIVALESVVDIKYDKLIIYSDSQYVVKGINIWIHNWKKAHYRAGGGYRKNKDLWIKLDNLKRVTKAKVKWARGHDGNEFNEIADQLCSNIISPNIDDYSPESYLKEDV